MSRAFIQKIGYFAPSQLSGLSLWLDGADINGNGTAFSVGGTISTWVDKSSLGNNMTGTSVTYTYDTTYAANAPTFNGSSSVFNQANSGLYSLNNSTTWTVFTVNRRTNTSGINAVYNAKSPGSGQNNYLIYRYASSSGFQFYLGDTTGTYISSSGTGDGITTLTAQTSGTAEGFINGSSIGTGSTSSSSGQATFTIGLQTGAYMFGFIFEVIVYNRGLSTPQQQSIEGYLAQKWGLVSSLPAGHPGRSQNFYIKNPGIAAVPSFTITEVPYSNYFPLSIAGCTMWLDGADSSKVLLNGSTVSQWTDKSAAGNNATQPTAGNQPSYSASGIVFAGNQWLITPIDVNPTAESFFIVFKTTNNLAEIFSGTNGNGREVLVVGGVMSLSKYGTNPVGLTPNGGSVSTNTVTLFDYQYTTSLVTLNVNGLQTGSGAPPVTYSGTGTSYIGSSTYAPNNMYGTIYEIIYYNVSLTTNQCQLIEGYLAWKWGITLTNTHPYYSRPPLEFGRPTQVAGIPIQVKMTATPNLTLPSNTITNGLVAYFLFNGTLLDSRNTITLSQTGSVSYVTGLRNQAVYLANAANVTGSTFTSNYLTTTYNLPTVFTVSFWFYSTTPVSGYHGSFMFSTYNNPSGFVNNSISVYFQSGNMNCAFNNIQNNGAGFAVSINTWYNAIITYNNGSLTLFANGSQSGSTISGTAVLNAGFMLGCGADGGGPYPFAGYLEDLRIYNRILSGSEITSIYNGTG